MLDDYRTVRVELDLSAYSKTEVGSHVIALREMITKLSNKTALL